MEDICTGCLCSGRKLLYISGTGFYQIYSQILNETSILEVSQVSVKLCWECCALLKKFNHFKEQVKRNYTELLWNVTASQAPHLTSTSIYNLSYPEQLKDAIKEEVSEDIKIEYDHVEPTEYDHIEPVAFVNDLAVERDDKKSDKPTKKSKKKTKEKKPSKSKIKVKKKKNSKPPEIQKEIEPISEGISDSDVLLDDYQNDRIEEKTDVEEIGNRNDKKEASEATGAAFASEATEAAFACEATEAAFASEATEAAFASKATEHEATEATEAAFAREATEAAFACEASEAAFASKATEVTKPVEAPVLQPKAMELLPDKPQCAECGKTFSSRKTYRYHLNVLHKGNNRYPCPRCGKIYQWKSNLGRHMRTHKAVDAGELYCEECDKSFASVATYRQHLRISRRHVSENEFSFTCNECGKKFVNKTRLRDHIDWEHLKKIKFRCQLCNKPFKCHTSLYVHLQNVHRNKEKKDNLCHVCGKSYQNAAKLKYHIIALHTGETPYQCSQCSAAFGWYSSLYRHIREVHYKVKAQPKKTKRVKKLDIEPPAYMNYHP